MSPCNSAHTAEVELSDEDGNVKNLRAVPERCAAELLAERERLVLLRVDSEGLAVLDKFENGKRRGERKVLK